MRVSDPHFSASEIGGLLASAVAVLVTLGGAVRWLFGWNEGRAATLHAKLLRWETKLEEREARLDAEQAGHMAALERRVEQVELQNAALRTSYHVVASELRARDPANMRLRQTDMLLRNAFPSDPVLPPDMEALISKLSKEAIDHGRPE